MPIEKNQLSIEEYNAILDLFYTEVIIPNQSKMQNIVISYSESDVFDPKSCITKEALEKLEIFCNLANKSTGSSYPSDEERWFDFICQTVDDGRTFDYDTIYRFLIDEDYWGKKEDSFIGVIGRFAWDKEQAGELAAEYDNYVRILEFYRNKKF